MPQNVSSLAPATRLVHGGTERSSFGETAEALFLTSGFVYNSAEQAEATFDGSAEHYQYPRFANPTVAMLEERLALIEGAEACRATATGMAAVNAALLSHLNTGDRIVASRALFGGCHWIVSTLLPRFGIQTEFVDGSDLNQWQRALSRPPSSSCSRPRPIRCSKWLTCVPCRKWPMPPAPSSWWTTSSPRRCCNGRSNSAPTSWSIPAPSISTVRDACSAAPCSAARSGSKRPCSPSSATPDPLCPRSTPGCCLRAWRRCPPASTLRAEALLASPTSSRTSPPSRASGIPHAPIIPSARWGNHK